MINLRPLLNSKNSWQVWLDIIMVMLAIINLLWLVFDSLFATQGFSTLLSSLIGNTAVNFYGQHIHPNFFFYDLIFVSIFLTEFFTRWAIAVYQRTYDHWASYPFIHWYDILSCIPIGELRWLRILRVIAVVYRLQKLQVINITRWPGWRLVTRLYSIVMEEISDRVVIQIISGVQDEIKHSDELEKALIEQVVIPRQQQLVDAITGQIAQSVRNTYDTNRLEIDNFIRELVSEAVTNNAEVKSIDRIPMLGKFAVNTLDHAVTDIVLGVIERAAHGLDGPEFHQLVEKLTGSVMTAFTSSQPTSTNTATLQNAIVDSLEVVKQQVAVRRWAIVKPAAGTHTNTEAL